MKRLLTKAQVVAILAIAIFGVLCAGSAQAQDPNANNLFDISRVLTLNITMDPGDWDALVAACTDGQCIPDANCDHEYWQATLQCGTVGPMLVAIRRKNDEAEPSEADPQKVSLKIDINRYVPGQLFAIIYLHFQPTFQKTHQDPANRPYCHLHPGRCLQMGCEGFEAIGCRGWQSLKSPRCRLR